MAHALLGDEQDASGDYEDATDDVEYRGTDKHIANLTAKLLNRFDSLFFFYAVILDVYHYGVSQLKRCCLSKI